MSKLTVEPRLDGQRTELHFSDGTDPVWWEWRFPEDWTFMPPANANWAAIDGLIAAQPRGGTLHVAGAVDKQLLQNLEQLSDIAAVWKPDRLHPVRITADKETTSRGPRRNGHVFALSAGVDASFSLLRHSRGLAERQNRKPACAVTMVGLLFRPVEDPGLDDLMASAGAIAAAAGVPHLQVRTNWLDICSELVVQLPAGLAATLHQFNGSCRGAVIAADANYTRECVLLPGWGSTQYTNPLLCSTDFEFQTFGGAFSRPERVADVISEAEIARHVRVCNTAFHKGHNCGRCEKCVRTMLLAMAAAGTSRPMFEADPSVRQILAINIRDVWARGIWREVRNHLGANQWRERLAVQAILLRSYLQVPLKRLELSVRPLVRRFRRGKGIRELRKQ